MADRMKRIEKWAYFEKALKASEVAVKGEIACLDTASGDLVASGIATTLIPIGYFEASGTGDGTVVYRVKLFEEITVNRFTNDGTNPVLAAHVGSDCYLFNGSTVSSNSTGTSVAGRVWGVSSAGVMVQVPQP